MDQWYYLEADGSQRGPLALDQLLAALRSRPPQTPVWRSGMAQWAPADSVPELRAALTSAAPMAPAPQAAPAPRPAPAMGAGAQAPAAVRPGYGAIGPRAASAEEPSLNLWSVFKRSFMPRGRFSRGEFAIAYFGPTVTAVILYLIGFLVAALLGAAGGRTGGGAAVVVLVLTFLPAILIAILSVYTTFVACIRRLIDRGHSPWMALLMLLPCVNFVLLCYLLFAPTRPAEAEQVLATANPVIVLVGVVAAFGVVFVIGIIAAVAIPSLLRARVSANESMAIGDIRTVISAEAAYQSANGGYYDNLGCLAAPQKQCIPSYSTSSPTFLDPALASAEVKGGYRRTFHPGPTPARRPTGTSPSSIESYAYVAVPATPGQTGVRAFCGDSSGLVRVNKDGSAPQVVDGKCDESSPPL